MSPANNPSLPTEKTWSTDSRTARIPVHHRFGLARYPGSREKIPPLQQFDLQHLEVIIGGLIPERVLGYRAGVRAAFEHEFRRQGRDEVKRHSANVATFRNANASQPSLNDFPPPGVLIAQ